MRKHERLNFLSSILESYIGSNEVPAIENLKLKPIDLSSSNTSNIYSDENQEICAKKIAKSIKKRSTWENINENEDNSIRSFSIESSEPFIYHRLKLSQKYVRPETAEITVISFPKFLNDIKLLMIGIESESFKRTETTLKFYITTKLCCEDISDVDHILEKILEIGTCFTRLKSYTSKNPFNQNQIFEGFIFKAFCDRVVKFLNYCRDIIYTQEADTILELYHNTSKLTKIIIHLSTFLNIHPSSTRQRAAILTGSDFLRLLYHEFTYVLDNNVKCFYIDLLKACCEVYYVRFQEWLYHGKLEDTYKELFIYYVDRYKENTKHFFDKAYLIRKQSVPEFLDCAENILLCGKYTILLKSFNPVVSLKHKSKFNVDLEMHKIYFYSQHPLFLIKKPSFKICLTFDEINELKERCREFSKKAKEECGEIISVSEILEERRRRKLEKYKNAEIASTKNAQKWKQYQEERLHQIREIREQQQKELRKELELIEEKKMLKRALEIQAERDYMDELENIENEELQIENEELKARIKIYQELNDKLSKDVENVEQEQKSSEKTVVTTVEDALNANSTIDTDDVVKDEMNNILEKKKSISLTDAQKNKLKVMSHEYNLNNIKKDEENNNNNNNDECTKVLTDAQKNKLKVMGHEFGMIEEDEKDKNNQPKISVQDFDKMTDLQKNRLKVLSHEFGIDDEKKDEEINKSRKNTGSQAQKNITELQRNRQKVLSHEFGFEQICSHNDNDKNKSQVLVKEKSSPAKRKLSLELLKPTDTAHNLESPMSTTSDHFNSSNNNESLEKSSCTQNNNNSDYYEEDDDDDDDKLEMIRAFEEAIEKNENKFMRIKLSESTEHHSFTSFISASNEIMKMDTMALSQYLQMSLTLPLNAYMEILNNETLKMFIKDLDILSHFKSLRNYFLLMNGEFCSCICHEMFNKIESGVKPVELLNYQSLHMILDHALSRSRYYDPNTENLSFIVQNIPEKFELHSPGILNVLTLSYQLDWPLSLILNPETMDKYRAIFNYLMKLKRITWILEQCFQILKESHKKYGTDLLKSEQYRNVQQIRHQMTQFVNCLENYVTHNVIQISWSGFVEDIKSAESILCIYRKHANYLKRILFLCLLNKSYTDFYKNIEDIFKVILKFYK